MEGEEGVRHKDRTAIHGAVNASSSLASSTTIKKMVNKSERKLRRVVRGPSVEGALEIRFIVMHGGGKPTIF